MSSRSAVAEGRETEPSPALRHVLASATAVFAPAVIALVEAVKYGGEHADVVFGMGLAAAAFQAAVWGLVWVATPRSFSSPQKMRMAAWGSWAALLLSIGGFAFFEHPAGAAAIYLAFSTLLLLAAWSSSCALSVSADER